MQRNRQELYQRQARTIQETGKDYTRDKALVAELRADGDAHVTPIAPWLDGCWDAIDDRVLHVSLRRRETHEAQPAKMLSAVGTLHVVAPTILEDERFARRTQLCTAFIDLALLFSIECHTTAFVGGFLAGDAESMTVRTSGANTMTRSTFATTAEDKPFLCIIASRVFTKHNHAMSPLSI
jgi:hypothetical protein